MKKRLTLFILLVLLLAVAFAFSVNAATQVADDGTNLTLGACTIEGLDGVTIPSPTSGLVYTLDEKTGKAYVSGRGTFAGGDLVFPSSVTYEGVTYPLTKINSGLFQNLTYNIYVPDSVTLIAGGPSSGTFGNSTISKVYIGSGLTSFEQETFSGSKGYEVFICKSQLTYIGVNAFNENRPSDNGTTIEIDFSKVTRFEDRACAGASFLKYTSITLSPNVEYIGSNAFVETRVKGSVIVPENCQLGDRCFNGTSFEQVVIKVAKGTTRQLPLELFSGATAGLTVIFTGTVEANQDHVFSGNSMSVYMQSYDDINTLVSTAAEKSGNERIASATFYACKEGKSYTAAKDGTITENGVGQHAYDTVPTHFPADCSNYEKDSYICYVCGYEDVVFEGTEYGDHVIKTTVKEPTCQSNGYYEYVCTVCGYSESAHIVPKNNHSATVITYKSNGTQYLTVTKSCEFCNEVVETERVDLVNKCYIDGYGFFDATMDYVSVDANGVATPGAAGFDNAVIYFPSYAMVDGRAVEVKTVQGFKAKSIKGIYIPDTVTRIAGGGGAGCFGDISVLKNVVVGKGVTAIEQETFCMGNGATLDEFIFKGTITRIEPYAFKDLRQASGDIPYEFNTALTYVGTQVNSKGSVIREAKIEKNCQIAAKAFNDANALLTVYIEGGDTPETALDLGQEFTSNTCTKYWYIKGYVTVSGQAVLSGQDNSRIYMESTAAIDLFANAIKAQGYNDRINKAVFMDCGEDKAWYVSNSADRVASSVAYSHNGVFTETNSTCTQEGIREEICFVCGETVSSEVVERKEHVFDGGVITSMPTDSEAGEIVYTCLICYQTETKEIAPISGEHGLEIFLAYDNGFGSKGLETSVCHDCDCVLTRELEPIFIVLGYSVSEEKTSIISRSKINSEALKYYEAYSGEMEIGFIVAGASDVMSKGLVDEDNRLVSGIVGCQIIMQDRDFMNLEIKLFGITTEASRAYNFIFAAYVVDKDKISYIQYQEKSSLDVVVGDYTLKAINVNTAYEE
ncbi:MAG: hypothetical protein E7602_03405 [Ruminococcaceae bacterium]|nr:hypothetical protein [Oscillospiraceae bacterium]